MKSNTSHDRIEKEITLRAPVSRVWKAIVDAAEFGRWFGVKLDGAFAPGRPSPARSTRALPMRPH